MQILGLLRSEATQCYLAQRSGAPALAQQDLNNRSRIQLEHGSKLQNPLPLPPYLSKDNALKLGASVSHVEGALACSFDEYEI